MNNRTMTAIILAGLLIPLGAGAQVSTASVKKFPDFLSIRSEFLSALIVATPSRALAFKPTMRDSPDGRVRISVEREGSDFYILFERERHGDVPLVSKGNVIIRRDVATGYVTRLVWYLSDDGLSYISLSPKNERTLVDYVVAGTLIRGDYSVSRLIYYFFTNNFAYLYDATRTGLDWSLVLGDPGPETSARLASSMLAGGNSPLSMALIRGAEDLEALERYVQLSGSAEDSPKEERASQFAKAASLDDPRNPTLVSVPAWSEASGIALRLAGGVILSGMAQDSAYIAHVGADGSFPSLHLAIVPYRKADGSYCIAALDAKTRKPVDFLALLEARPKASARLFRLAIPASH